MRFEVLAAAKIWVVTRCGLVGGISYLKIEAVCSCVGTHLQVHKASPLVRPPWKTEMFAAVDELKKRFMQSG
jgi:hypothetical protein